MLTSSASGKGFLIAGAAILSIALIGVQFNMMRSVQTALAACPPVASEDEAAVGDSQVVLSVPSGNAVVAPGQTVAITLAATGLTPSEIRQLSTGFELLWQGNAQNILSESVRMYGTDFVSMEDGDAQISWEVPQLPSGKYSLVPRLDRAGGLSVSSVPVSIQVQSAIASPVWAGAPESGTLSSEALDIPLYNLAGNEAEVVADLKIYEGGRVSSKLERASAKGSVQIKADERAATLSLELPERTDRMYAPIVAGTISFPGYVQHVEFPLVGLSVPAPRIAFLSAEKSGSRFYQSISATVCASTELEGAADGVSAELIVKDGGVKIFTTPLQSINDSESLAAKAVEKRLTLKDADEVEVRLYKNSRLIDVMNRPL